MRRTLGFRLHVYTEFILVISYKSRLTTVCLRGVFLFPGRRCETNVTADVRVARGVWRVGNYAIMLLVGYTHNTRTHNFIILCNLSDSSRLMCSKNVSVRSKP